jgi:hypothetical protein
MKELMNERMNGEYKNIMKRIMMMIMAVALMALPTMAQQPEWKSTSTMQGTGSAYVPQVTAVGATDVNSMATTTESYSPAKAPSGPRRGFIDPSNPGNQSNEFPIGDAVLPLLLMSLAFAGVIYFRKRHARA